jgi:hypothetical protein
MTSPQIDLGTQPAKYSNYDPALVLMRQIRSRGKNITRGEAIRKFCAAALEAEDLTRECVEYTAAAAWNRTSPRTHEVDDDRREKTTEARKAIREVIQAKIALWKMVLPTNAKRLWDSTFEEVAEAAPLLGKFHAQLATLGAPGTLVREVFHKRKAALQELWNKCQE